MPTSIYEWTNVLIGNLFGSDSPPFPTPVHTLCWEARPSYQRVIGAKEYAVAGTVHTGSLPAGTPCYLCRKVI